MSGRYWARVVFAALAIVFVSAFVVTAQQYNTVQANSFSSASDPVPVSSAKPDVSDITPAPASGAPEVRWIDSTAYCRYCNNPCSFGIMPEPGQVVVHGGPFGCGKEITWQRRTCMACNGTRKLRCTSSSLQAYVSAGFGFPGTYHNLLTTCNGTGKAIVYGERIQCKSCEGTGELACGVCKATGEYPPP